jgi:hypothetical protein
MIATAFETSATVAVDDAMPQNLFDFSLLRPSRTVGRYQYDLVRVLVPQYVPVQYSTYVLLEMNSVSAPAEGGRQRGLEDPPQNYGGHSPLLAIRQKQFEKMKKRIS